jgi:hypothetical protein
MIGHVIGLINNTNQDSVDILEASLNDAIIIPRFTRYDNKTYNVIINQLFDQNNYLRCLEGYTSLVVTR